jgi:pimeloyl-ACP methyl ester carboxylesterase
MLVSDEADWSRSAGDRRRFAAVLVANGDSDPMILPRYSYLLAGLLPNTRLTIYPDSAHGFLFQHHSQFGADVDALLEETD